MNIKKFSNTFYTTISKYWSYDSINDNNKYTEYKATNILYNIEDVVEYIKLSTMGLNLSHLEYMKYYYNTNITDFDVEKLPILDTSEVSIMKDEMIDKKVKSSINTKIEMRGKLRKRVSVLQEKLKELEDKTRKDVYRKIGDKKIIDKNLNDREHIESDIKSYVYKNNPKLIKSIHNNKVLVHELSDDIKKLRENLYVEIPKTHNINKKRRDIESYSINTLFVFLTKYKLKNDFLSEIRKDETNYSFKRIVTFYTPPITEAINILNDQMPISLDNIQASGYIPFTSDKISGRDSDNIKKNEIDWWIMFFKNKNSVDKKLKKNGLSFLKNIDVYNKVK